MNINHPNNRDFIFSRNDSEIIVSGLDQGARLTVNISDDGRNMKFQAASYGGKYILRLNDILKSLEENTIAPNIPTGSFAVIKPRQTTITFGLLGDLSYLPVEEKSCTIKWVPGLCPEKGKMYDMMLSGRYWWTGRPQSYKTYKWSREILQTAVPSGNSKVSIIIELHLAQTGKARIEYCTIPVKEACLIAIDVSYRSIEAKAISLGYDDRILAYDVSGSMDGGSEVVGQRFIVAPNLRDVRGWFFRNSTGSFDSVYSLGKFARAIDSESKNFITRDKEIELRNISKEVHSVDTGYIGDEIELNLWYEFLRSSERYAISDDGNIYRIVVDSESSEKTLGETGSLTFKCRMSDDIKGYMFSKSELEDFSEGFT